MTELVLKGLISLLAMDLRLHLFGFLALQRAVMKKKISAALEPAHSVPAVCEAMDLACVFYIRRISALHRGASTVFLLRNNGFPAQLVVGIQMIPMETHAWVEISGQTVNERTSAIDAYQVLDRY